MNVWKNRLRGLGGVIVILGGLLPWQCYQGFSSGCSRMIDLRPLEVIFSSPEHFILTSMGIVLAGLLLNAVGLGLKKILIVYLDLVFLDGDYLGHAGQVVKQNSIGNCCDSRLCCAGMLRICNTPAINQVRGRSEDISAARAAIDCPGFDDHYLLPGRA